MKVSNPFRSSRGRMSPSALAVALSILVALVLPCSHLTHGYITFPAATAALRKLPGFEGATLNAPEDLNTFVEQLSKAPALIQTDFQNLLQQASVIAKSLPVVKNQDFANVLVNLQIVADQITTKINSYENGVYIAYGVLAFFGLTFLSLVGKASQSSSSSRLSAEPYGKTARYDPLLAAAYFSSRPLLVFNRGVEIGAVASLYGLGLLMDLITGKLTDPKQEEKRADQLSEVLTSLGPTFIKVGQSLSIRTDLLRPAYIKGLTKLQDCVPSFETSIAREIIEQELGAPADMIFLSGIEPSAKVVAAASLGQVYKAVLRSDFSEVAIKVQRPDILTRVALDMHLLRILSVPIKALAGLQTDLAGVIDDWGTGFVDELDYQKEATNAEVFMEAIAKTPLKDAVFAPPVVRAYSSRRVLTTKWIDGDKLDSSNSADVAALCSVAMNTYLTMMLECSILHCDPHPGNLKRTPDGRLCILDWGLVTVLKPDLQLSYIEHIAHLTSKDYAKVPSDLVKLGFVPEGKQKAVLEAGVVDVLSSVYTKFAGGGGAAKIDVNQVISEMNGLAGTYGNLFQLPPYFAYIARAFGVLEGIGLTVDPDYAIVGECLPYISQRLLTDNSERTGSALSTFIFGAEKDNEDRVIDADRLKLLFEGFNSYDGAINVAGAGERSADASAAAAEFIEKAAAQLVDLMVAGGRKQDGQVTGFDSVSKIGLDPSQLTPLQRLVLEEVGKILGARARRTFSSVKESSGRLPTGRTLLGTFIDPLGIFSSSTLVEMDDADERTLEAAGKLLEILQNADGTSKAPSNVLQDITPADARKLAASISRRLWEKRTELAVLTGHLAYVMLRQTARRLEKPKVVKKRKSSDDVSTEDTGILSAEQGASFNDDFSTAKAGPISTPVSVVGLSDSSSGGESESGRLSRARGMLMAARLNDGIVNDA